MPADFEVIYCPPDYGDVIPMVECRHDPAGHRMELGLEIVSRPKRGQARIIIAGQFCMKCGWCWHRDVNDGALAEAGSPEWWHIWQIARAEFGHKCWQFGCRLSELAEQVGHLSRLLGIGQCRSQLNAQHAHKIVRHPIYQKRANPRKQEPLQFRPRRVKWAAWPNLHGRAA